MNTRAYQLVFPASASRKLGRSLDRFEKDQQNEWDRYQRQLKQAQEEQDPVMRRACEDCAETYLRFWKLMPNKYYIKTPHVCAISMTEDFYHTYMDHILNQYKIYDGIPVCSFYYLKSDVGMFFLNMEFTRNGKSFTGAQKTQMPGEAIRGFPSKFYAEDDQDSIEEKQTLAHFFGLYNEDHRTPDWDRLGDAWDKIWGDTGMGAEETVRALSEFLQFPVLFPLFPCEKAKLVKQNQRIERYSIPGRAKVITFERRGGTVTVRDR